MFLTGRPLGPPLSARGAPAVAARGAMLAFELLSHLAGRRVRLDGAALLGERAALAGLRRHGERSPGEACRLLSTREGWLALSLARPDDVALVPALIGCECTRDAWSEVSAWARQLPAADAAARGQLLGLPAAALPSQQQNEQARVRPARDSAPWTLSPGSARRDPAGRPLVVDLSALWAGPLCGHLLSLAGARVVKVESPHRPDGARRGSAAFFALLHAGQESVALDLRTTSGRDSLQRLLRSADVVIESSRPRALAQLGILAEEVVADVDGIVWVSITAYGRRGPWRNRVGFGDDAAVAGGLVADDSDGPVFAGDAIADPLAGLHAAVAALACVVGGHGALIDVAMRDCARAAAQIPSPAAVASRQPRGCLVPAGGDVAPTPVARPRARPAAGGAPALGADTARLLPVG
jgi:hypothetical protein